MELVALPDVPREALRLGFRVRYRPLYNAVLDGRVPAVRRAGRGYIARGARQAAAELGTPVDAGDGPPQAAA